MLDLFLEFWTLNDPNVIWVLSGAILLGSSTGVLGSFLFFRKRSLIGDALAHAALPGVMSAFILFQTRDPLVILSGAIISCFIGFFFIDYLTKHTKIKEDSALAIVLSLFFAIGIFELTYIQKLSVAAKSGLDKILFGQAAALVQADVIILGIAAALSLNIVILFYDKLRFITLDRQFAQAMGMNVVFYELLLTFAIVLSVVVGLQIFGVVLMTAALLFPVAAGRYWSDCLPWILVLCAIFGAFSGAISANISYLAPQMPTGPWMVVVLSFIFLLSMLFSPHRGVLVRSLRHAQKVKRTHDENVLRTFYVIGERSQTPQALLAHEQVLSVRNMEAKALQHSLKRLLQQGFLEKQQYLYRLTEKGLHEAQKITRYHRLWELYLTERANIDPNTVHDSAEQVEHWLTPELEKRISDELDNPKQDPHGRSIPNRIRLVGDST